MAAAAFDAEFLIDARLGDVVEVVVLPVGELWARRGDDVVEGAGPLIHPVRQPVESHPSAVTIWEA